MNLTQKEISKKRMYVLMIILVFVWTGIMLILLLSELKRNKHFIIETSKIQARSLIERDITYRSWNALHGGVYVPISEHTQPNSYLISVPDRDIFTPNDSFTMINPAFMTRQVHELAMSKYGVYSHITSLDPIRPENAPDFWETKALHFFERNSTEYSEYLQTDSGEYLKLMIPLISEQACLKCHEDQGYKVGDIRGGISTTIPLDPVMGVNEKIITKIYVGHIIALLLGAFSIIVIGKKAIRNRKERKQFNEKVLSANNKLKYSKQQLSYALDNVISGFWDWNMKTDEVYYSANWCKSLGYKTDEVDNTPSFRKSILHPDDTEKTAQELEKHINGETDVYRVENRIRMKNNTYRYNLSIGKVVERDQDGNPLRMVGSDTDITAEKEAEIELKLYKEYLEELVEQRTTNLTLKNKELELKNKDLEYYHDLFIQREFRIKELRDEISDLKRKMIK
jgi:PAS domain S-box-containing protein